MSTEIASLFAKISVDMTGLTNGLTSTKSQLEGAASQTSVLTGAMSSGLAVAAGLATAGVVALGGALAYSVAQAMEAQAVSSQLDAVLKSTGGGAGVTAKMATDLANSLSEVTRFSDEAVLSGENMLLTFTGIGKDVFPDATAIMLDMSQALGQDLKSSSIQLGKALNSPKDGLTALTRVGVTFTAEQKNLVKSLQASGDIAGAQKVILQELQKEFGGSAEAAGQTFAGQLDILKNKLSNVAETVGTQLLPMGQALLSKWGPVFTDLAGAAGAFFTTILSGDIGGAFDSLGEYDSVRAIFQALGVSGTEFYKIGPAVEQAWAGATATFKTWGAWAQSNLLPLFGRVYDWLATNIPAAVQTLANFWTGTLLPSLVNVGGWIQGNLFPLLTNLWGILADAGGNSLQQLSAYWSGVLLPALVGFWSWTQANIFPLLSQLWTWIATNLPVAVQGLATFWNGVLLPALIAFNTWMIGNFWPMFGELYAWLAMNIPTALQTLSAFWTGTLQPALAAFWGWVQGTVFPLLSQLGTWLQTNIPAALQTLANFWTSTLLPALAAVWGWVQTTVFPLLTQLATWLATNIPAALQTLANFWTVTLWPAIQAVWSWMSTVLFPFFMALSDFMSAVFGKAVEALAGLWQSVLQPALFGAWQILNDDLFPVFVAIGDYLKKTLQPIFEALGKFFSETLMPILKSLYENFLVAIKGVFQDIGGAISDATKMLKDLATAITNLTLPDWLTPGSPTPFELGIRGITKAMDDLTGAALPKLSVGFSDMVASAPVAFAAGGASGGVGSGSNSYGDVIFNISGAGDPDAVAGAVVQKLKDRGLISQTTLR